MSSQDYSDQEYSGQGYMDQGSQQPGAGSSTQGSTGSGSVSRTQSSGVSASHQAAAHTKKGSDHLGLKVLIGGLVLVTLMFVVANVANNLRIFWNTLVWILAIIGLIWAFVKIRELEKKHDQQQSQSGR